ncbi:MAG TPA: pilus assembly protein N-terminal domain-containing protein [bacterium]|nr:pilus assembly protein N-terminal domain-containing protein [bacterium]HQG46368.1 pilus assembly protein N-terminal domain-containing protein [bacterium]HQI48290.1 pilus assembly protein N-terminal domain-containing protein [bacterium]HQJ64906.1 pilus assembly protein N-terminal domain-containing protein [bacterium]
MLWKMRMLASAGAMILAAMVLVFAIHAQAAEEAELLTVEPGHSQVLDYQRGITRVSIADPEVADANVISASQLVLIGKAEGSTNLIVWDAQGHYQQFNILVRKPMALHQIMLQVRFVEIDRTAIRDLGLDFLIKDRKVGHERITVGSFTGQAAIVNDPLGLSETVDLLIALPSQNVTAMLKALEEKNLITVLAKPNLSAREGAEASFLAGGEFPIPIVSGAAGMQTVTIQFKEFGIKLKFTPNVLDSSMINLKVAAEVSSLDFENGITLSGFVIPALSTRKTETNVDLKENHYLIIGGLFSEEQARTLSRVPLLGSVPVLGRLFSSEHFSKKESELMILVSPRITSGVAQLPSEGMNP